MYKIIVTKFDQVFLESKPISIDELAGFLSIINKPSMFGSKEFDVTIKRV